MNYDKRVKPVADAIYKARREPLKSGRAIHVVEAAIAASDATLEVTDTAMIAFWAAVEPYTLGLDVDVMVKARDGVKAALTAMQGTSSDG